MKCWLTNGIVAGVVISIVAGSGIARAQHFDVLVQQQEGALVTGSADFDSNQWTLGRRVFLRDFDEDFAINNPGFNALGSAAPNLPFGSGALPASEALSWDFLPMEIAAVGSNLFYWNGLDSDGVGGLSPDDVAFGLPPTGYRLGLFDKANSGHFVDGTDDFVPGGVIDNTAADGSLHRHRFFCLDDGNGCGASQPVDGIYLVAMQLRMTGLESAQPIFFVFGTPGSAVAALDDAAVPWVEQHVETLVVTGLPGDYNANGIVDAADYTVWRDLLGQSNNLPNEGASPNLIDAGDFEFWKANFGPSVDIGAGSVEVLRVPEPTSARLLVVGFVLSLTIWRQQSTDRGLESAQLPR